MAKPKVKRPEMFCGLSAAEIKSLNSVGCGGVPTAKMGARLVEKGLLLVGHEQRRDKLGTFFVPRYEMPTSVHMAWCRWQSDIYEAEQA